MEKAFCWLKNSEHVELKNEHFLLVKAQSARQQQEVVDMVSQAGMKYCVIAIHDCIISLVFSEQSISLSFPAEVQHVNLPMHPLCEITAFLDVSQQSSNYIDNKEFFLNAELNSYHELIYWFICSYLMGNGHADYPVLLDHIRKQEPYFLMVYLIENRCSNEKINTLCQNYGLSYSYFRKISKKYLGVSAKAKMSEWRLAQTILDILEGESSITDIALKNGYSSSAHVSSTFKSVLGISPYAIRKINGRCQ